MTYETLGERNMSEGFHVLFVYVNDVTNGLFSILLLVAFFVIAFMGSFFSQQRLIGRRDVASSFAAASYITVIASILMALIPGMLNIYVVIIWIAVAILGTLWLFLSNASD